MFSVRPKSKALLRTCSTIGNPNNLYIIFFGNLLDAKCAGIKQPILIVGNPRSGTTFLHHYLTSNNFGTGSQLWQMLYPSVLFQKILKPILPFLEKYSPTKYHSTDAHKTSLQSVETDDASILFRFSRSKFRIVTKNLSN